MRRTLSLKREVLAELSAAELADVVAGNRQTQFSCLDYISCYAWQCLPKTLLCVE